MAAWNAVAPAFFRGETMRRDTQELLLRPDQPG
jgi:hypothetical protein